MLLLALYGFLPAKKHDPFPVVAPPDALTSDERLLAGRLAGSMLVPVPGLGLAAGGPTRARWLGISPPGPTERAVEVDVEGTRRQLPVWQALRELPFTAEPIHPQVAGQLSAEERWQVLAECASGAYGGRAMGGTFRSPQIQRELERTPGDAAFLERVAMVADEVAARIAAAVGMELPLGRLEPDPASASLLLLPLIRGGVALKPAWDWLIHFGPDPESRAVLEALPRERREAAVSRYLDRHPFSQGPPLDRLSGVLDLVPTRSITARLLEGFATGQVSFKDAVLETVKRFAADHPEIAAAVADFEARPGAAAKTKVAPAKKKRAAQRARKPRPRR